MMHVYLTEDKIKQARDARVITEREAEELMAKMLRCGKVNKGRAA